MRAMKRTGLVFGLVNVKVAVYKATESKAPSEHQYHAADMGRIRYAKVCADCGETIDAADVVKAFDVDGSVVMLSDEERKPLEVEIGDSIEVVQFSREDEIDHLYWGQPYYLEPDKSSVEGYALLRGAMTESGLVAVTRMRMRTKITLGVVRVVGDMLVMHTLSFSDELRPAEFPILASQPAVSEKAKAMAATLVESMTAPFDPAAFTDVASARLRELIEAKVSGGEFAAVEPPADDPVVADLLAQLEQSIAKHPAGKQSRSRKKKVSA